MEPVYGYQLLFNAATGLGICYSTVVSGTVDRGTTMRDY